MIFWKSKGQEVLNVPQKFDRNEKSVTAMGNPADTGADLIDYMCRRIGVDNLGGLDVFDIGCGVRFSQSLLNRELPIGSYTGVEVNKKIVKFLNKNVMDERFSYHHSSAINQLYNKRGKKNNALNEGALGQSRFDVVCMFSVITHQRPEEAIESFKLARKHIKNDGALFFSAFIHVDDGAEFKELVADNPGEKSSYSYPYIEKLLFENGWEVSSFADPLPEDLPIMSSILCRPVEMLAEK